MPVTIEFPEMKIADAWKIEEGKEWKVDDERLVSDQELEELGAKPQVSTK